MGAFVDVEYSEDRKRMTIEIREAEKNPLSSEDIRTALNHIREIIDAEDEAKAATLQ